MSGHFSYSRWDPILISTQIVAIQTTFYLSLGFILFFIANLFGYYPTLDQIFNSQIVSFKTSLGLVITISFILNSFFGALILHFIVRRAKKCLDFTLTLFIIHLIMVRFYNGQIPSSFSWWLLNIICITIMCISGEYVCLQSELKAIPLLVANKVSSL
ncbi:sys1 golgi trafficking protein [Dermatophagoides farinae]|uniref:Integral membrane protein of the Golgi n=1 Tax=Dermatophagoides farinae TaxID=6954 RepID=A0A922ICS4_DERFA|nr:protein SYS1 homolog [Dermatophagoides farinae]KAH7642408.1 protein sys1-like protein [Dermatophagoides farinae]KAH9529657.1 Integral membrane protein of the Golgi [Dermatophagoides farinae]